MKTTPPKEFDLEQWAATVNLLIPLISPIHADLEWCEKEMRKCLVMGYKKALEQFEGEKRKLWWAAKRKVARSGTFEKTRIEDKYETLEDYYLSLKGGAE